MKVLLIKDVRDMGRSGTVVEVSSGHAMNFLLPRKLAVVANATNLKQADARQQKMEDMRAVDAELIAETLKSLADGLTTITKKANDKGHLYDAVGVAEIAAATKLPEDAIRLEKPIKELGEFEVPISYAGNFGSIKILIEAEL
jgi:large subunit ribosomal protein L9